jgi:acetyl esterase/lipase
MPEIEVDHAGVSEWCGSGPLGGPDLEPLAERVETEFYPSAAEIEGAVQEADPDEPLVVVRSRADSRLDHLDAERKIVWLEFDAAVERRTDHRVLIRGRGVNGYHWAVRAAHHHWRLPVATIPYGTEVEQVADLRLPPGVDGPFPVVVLLHGGYWREQWERDTIEPLAVALALRGYATWNVEYRRTGPGGGGGWPETFDDIAAAIDKLAEVAEDHPIDLARVVVAGHSAGGQQALWAAARSSFADGDTGGSPIVTPVLVVSLAGVVDLVRTAERCVGFGANAAAELMRAMPEEDRDRYEKTCPRLLPLPVPAILAQGTAGDDPDLIELCRNYVQARQADDVEYLELDDAEHFAVIDPEHPAWLAIERSISRRLPTL